MARFPFLRLALTVMLLIVASTGHTQTRTEPENQPKAQAQKGVELQLSSMKTPLVFEPNRGQAVSEFQWIGRGAGFRVGIGSDGAVLEFRDRTAPAPSRRLFANASELTKSRQKQKSAQSTLVKFHLLGSNGWKLAGASPTGGSATILSGAKPTAGIRMFRITLR